METVAANCNKCGTPLNDLGVSPRKPCPVCGSLGRNVPADLADGIRAFDSLRAKTKRPSLPRRDRERADVFTGFEMCHDRGKMVRKDRVIDRDTRDYEELVVDPDTGETIHHTKHRLPDHQGHGSAKKNP